MEDIVERLMQDKSNCSSQFEREAYCTLGNLLREAAEEIIILRELEKSKKERIDNLEQEIIRMSDWRNL
jgi:hypothetical protein